MRMLVTRSQQLVGESESTDVTPTQRQGKARDRASVMTQA